MDQPREKLFGLFFFLRLQRNAKLVCLWVNFGSLVTLAPCPMVSECLSKSEGPQGLTSIRCGMALWQQERHQKYQWAVFLGPNVIKPPILDKESSGEIIEIIRIHSD